MSTSSNMPIPFINGDEQDYLTGYYHRDASKRRRTQNGRGERKNVKRAYQRRARRAMRRKMLDEAAECLTH